MALLLFPYSDVTLHILCKPIKNHWSPSSLHVCMTLKAIHTGGWLGALRDYSNLLPLHSSCAVPSHEIDLCG